MGYTYVRKGRIFTMIKERLAKLREAMKEAGIDCYIIPTSDYHNSEYVSEYFMVRKYFSGFTGSAGTLVVHEDKAALFTDGRYFIQAARQLEVSGIALMKMGEPSVPELKEYVESPSLADQQKGFSHIELLSFSPARVVVRKSYEKEVGYFLLNENHYVVVYDRTLTHMYMNTGIRMEALPQSLQDEIMLMKYIETENELYNFLESYSS